MRYRVRHVTTYAYAVPVDLAAHLLHLDPRALPHQSIEELTLRAEPEPSRATEGHDHFGNRTRWLFLDRPHGRFEVTMEARVAVRFPDPPATDATPPWEEIARLAQTSDAAEFTYASPLAPSVPEAGGYAAPLLTPGAPILRVVRDLTAAIRRDFAFRAGVTTISTPIATVLAQRAGVCQDFSHLMIAALRWHGLPARYVSGYIRTRPPRGGIKRRGSDQSHAWVGAWLGPDHGWIDVDPTNDLVVAEEHVVLAWGRDYGDISPVRGVLLGGGRHGVTAGVDMDEI